MANSKILIDLSREARDKEMFARLKGEHWHEFNPIRAIGPNKKYPLPWIIDEFSNLNICSIISESKIDNTVVSIISTEIAKQVLHEIKDS